MKLVVIVTPKGTSAGETLSTVPFCVKTGLPARPVDGEVKNKTNNKNTKAETLPY
jgi:hypothetical protein